MTVPLFDFLLGVVLFLPAAYIGIKALAFVGGKFKSVFGFRNPQEEFAEDVLFGVFLCLFVFAVWAIVTAGMAFVSGAVKFVVERINLSGVLN